MKARMNIRSIIMVMAIICLASMFFINICFAANTGKIATETARLREQPQTDSKVLELASLGVEVEILEEVDGWYKVKYKNITGYIRTDLIEVENEENENTTETSNNTETENMTTENSAIENSITENSTTEVLTTENVTGTNVTAERNTMTVEETTIVEKGKYKISENVKLKIIPLISAIELDEINKNVEVEVTEILNDWAKIKTQDGKEGWIRTEKLTSIQEATTENNQQENSQEQQTEKSEVTETEKTTETSTQKTNTTKTMYVNSQTINLRQKADKTSKVIKQLTINTQVTVISSDNGWAYVDINGTKGYIAENLLSNTKQETSRSTTTERSTTNSTETTKADANKATTTTTTTNTIDTNTTKTDTDNTIANAASSTGTSVVAYAKQFLGCKYVYGGTTTKGFDCSGFTQYVYKHFGVNLNRTAAAQYSNGTSVTNLQAGDLVMFGKSGINHVGIYIGGNTFIHAANSSRGVTTDTLSSGYYKTNYVGARRIF